MNEDVIADLKQFIAATVSQQMSGVAMKDDLAGFATKDDLKGLATKEDIARVEQKIDDLQEAVAEALSNTNDAAEEQIDRRLAAHVRQYHQRAA